jgi:four helix bundle protein
MLIERCSHRYAFVDHLDRASESMIENIVCGNSQFSADGKCRYFEIAFGSALECAACLDVGFRRKAVSAEDCEAGKQDLVPIVRMLVGLIQSNQGHSEARESNEEYLVDSESDDTEHYFDHERLEVYQTALDFVSWSDALLQGRQLVARFSKRLDVLSTSTVLNIAEGNGRFGKKDHRSFIDIAYRSTLKSASLLDRMLARQMIEQSTHADGKDILDHVARMLSGMRDYLDE